MADGSEAVRVDPGSGIAPAGAPGRAVDRPGDDDVSRPHPGWQIAVGGLDDLDGVAHARDRELLEGTRTSSCNQSHEAAFRDQRDDVEGEAGDVRVVPEGA